MALKIFCIIILSVVLNASTLYASTAADIKKGNLLYSNKKYDEAIKVYDGALTENSENAILRFNKASALYRKENYNAAIESYNKALASGEARILPNSDYNIGNSQYRIGSAVAKTDVDKAKEAYETALEFYKRAIELKSNDRDAKYNYEFVDQKLMALKKEQEKEQRNKETKKQQN